MLAWLLACVPQHALDTLPRSPERALIRQLRLDMSDSRPCDPGWDGPHITEITPSLITAVREAAEDGRITPLMWAACTTRMWNAAEPVLHPLLSDEGPFSSARYEPVAAQASASTRR